MREMRGIVYVMRVIGEDALVKVGMTRRNVVARFGKNARYNGLNMAFHFSHYFEDVELAEKEIHALLHYARRDRTELFDVTPSQAQGAVLWYACETTIHPSQPRRELRIFRTYTATREQAERHGIRI